MDLFSKQVLIEAIKNSNATIDYIEDILDIEDIIHLSSSQVVNLQKAYDKYIANYSRNIPIRYTIYAKLFIKQLNKAI